MASSTPRTVRRPRTGAALALATIALLLAGPLALGSSIVPLSPSAQTALENAQAGGLLTPVDQLFEVEGRLTLVVPDPAPGTSGIAGTLTVNGFTFEVPVGVPVRVSDVPGEAIPFLDIDREVDGFPSLVNRSTIIATGSFDWADQNDHSLGLRFVADDVFLEEAENVLFGIVTSNNGTGLFVSGVPVVMETDPRFAPFNHIQDLVGRPLTIDEVPEGALLTLEGVFKNGAFHARLIEVDTIAPIPPGEPDIVSIDRAELRLPRNEVRARGFTNNLTGTVTLYESVAGAPGRQLGAPVAPDVDGAWVFRETLPAGFTFADPPTVLAVASGGGVAERELTIR